MIVSAANLIRPARPERARSGVEFYGAAAQDRMQADFLFCEYKLIALRRAGTSHQPVEKIVSCSLLIFKAAHVLPSFSPLVKVQGCARRVPRCCTNLPAGPCLPMFCIPSWTLARIGPLSLWVLTTRRSLQRPRQSPAMLKSRSSRRDLEPRMRCWPRARRSPGL